MLKVLVYVKNKIKNFAKAKIELGYLLKIVLLKKVTTYDMFYTYSELILFEKDDQDKSKFRF